jgi:hypothetical protein
MLSASEPSRDHSDNFEQVEDEYCEFTDFVTAPHAPQCQYGHKHKIRLITV